MKMNIKEAAEDYWDKIARQSIMVAKLRKLKEQEDERRQILLARRSR